MNEELLLHILATEVALADHFSQATIRPWGRLYHNRVNPSHQDANKARQIRTTDPKAVFGELTAFYHGLGLAPRATLDSLTEPADLAEHFRAHGYAVDSGALPVMTWEGPAPAPARLPTGVAIDRATAADAPWIGRIRSEALGYQPGWLTSMAARELTSPRYRYYIARVDDEPAACAALVDHGRPYRLEYVATRPSFQGRGLAFALVQQIQREAQGPLFLLYTRENAGRLYRRAGFTPAGDLVETECWLD